MTRFAKPLLLEIPCCQAKKIQRRFASINTFGLASRWSDGYCRMPLVQDASRLGYCGNCNKVYWLEDAVNLGIASPPESTTPPRFFPSRRGWWERLRLRLQGKNPDDLFGEALKHLAAIRERYESENCVQHPQSGDLLSAVQCELWDAPEREIYARTWLWWCCSHSQRGQRSDASILPAAANENRSSLLALHQRSLASDDAVLASGELLRQLGRFGEAIAMLTVLAERSTEAAAILAAARREETAVFELENF